MATEAKIKITGDESELVAALDNVKKESKKLQEDLGKVAKVGAVAFAGFAAGIAASVNEAAKFETIEAQFTTLTGSINIAKNTLKELKDFSATTPFQFEDIANAGRQLIAFGTPVEQVKNRLQEIGDVAAASGAPINDLTLIFGQVAAAGKLTGERLLQLQERAVPIGPALAKTLGVAESSVKDLVSQGKVSVDEFNEAFASLSQEGGFAFKGIEAQGKTLNGLLSTLGDNFSLVAAGVGEELLPAAKQVVGALIDFLGTIRENAGAVKALARILAAGAGMAAFATSVATAGIVLAKLKVGFQALIVTLRFGRIAAAAFTGALTLGLGFVIAFLPEIIAFLKDMVAAFNAAQEQIVAGFRRLGQNLLNIGAKIGDFLKNLFTFNFEGLKESASALRDSVNTAIEDAFSDVQKVKQVVEIDTERRQNEETAQAENQEKALAEQERIAKEAAEAKKKLREKEAKEQAAADAQATANRQAQFQREKELLLAERQGLSGELLKIKQEENDLLTALENAKTTEEKQLAQLRLDNFKQQAEERRIEAQNQQIMEREERKALQEEFALLDEEDRLLAQEQNLANLTAEQMARREVLIEAAEEEKRRKAAERKQFIKDEMQFGKTFAQINAAVNSERVNQAKSAASDLAAVQNSSSSTLKSIGKAAAVTQIGIDTAQGAASIFAKLNALVPLLAPAIGAAGAATIVAFGAEKISQVRSAQRGGVVPGSGSGDIVPTMLEPGEIVVPRALSPSFEQQFALDRDPEAPAQRQTEVRIDTVIGNEQFVREVVIPSIKDANEFENADLGVG